MADRTRTGELVLPMSKAEVDEWVCETFGLRELPPEVGLLLKGRHYARLRTEHSEADQDSCLEAVRNYLTVQSKESRQYAKRPVASRPRRKQHKLSDGALARAAFYDDHMRRVALADRALIAFRQRVLNGATLTSAQAASVLTSDATRFLPPEFFRSNNVPVVGHKTSACLPDGARAVSWDTNVLLRIEWDEGSYDVPYEKFWFMEVPHSDVQIAIPSKTGGSYSESVAWRSVLYDLREVSQRLARQLAWKEHHAVWFVLTGQLLSTGPADIWVSAGTAAGLAYGRITLELDAWLSAEDVQAIYAGVQQQSFKPFRRPCCQHQLRLYEFVRDLEDEAQHPISWTTKMEKWNGSGKGRQYSDRRMFRNHCKRAATWVMAELISPNYRCLRPESRRRSRKSKP